MRKVVRNNEKRSQVVLSGIVVSDTLGARDFSAYGQKCDGLRPIPKIPAARKKNLWYPG